MGSNMASAANIALTALQQDGYSKARAGGLLRATMSLVVGLASGGGSSANTHFGPVTEDALEVWLTGIQASKRQAG